MALFNSNIRNILLTSHENTVSTRFPSRVLMLLVVFKEIFLVNGQEESLQVYANEDARLNCSPTFEHQPEWQHLRDGNKKPVKLSLGDKLLDRYASNGRFSLFMDPPHRRYDLLIRNVVNGDAGIYTCNEDTDSRRIKLIVQKQMTKLLRSPTNTAVLTGKDTKLNCSTSFSAHVFWQHTPSDHPQTLQGVYYGLHSLQGQYKIVGRYAVVVNESMGQYDLTIHNVKPSDAGRFTCLDNDGEGETVSAELIVLGSIPSCVSNSTTEGREGAISANNTCGLDADFIKLTCSVIYFGHQPPTLKWFIDNISADEFPQTRSISTHQATSEIILEAQEWMQSTPVYCRIAESPWNSIQECSILVKLHEFSRVREAASVTISRSSASNMKCDAESTGRCVYEWKNETGEIVMHGQLLQPTHPNVVPGKYTCLSTCEIGGVKCTQVSLIATLASTTVWEIRHWMPMMLGITFVLIVTISTMVCCYCTEKTKTCLNEMLQRKDPNTQAVERVHFIPIWSNSAAVQRNVIFLDKFGEDRNEHVRSIAVLNTNVYLIRNQATHIEVYSFEFGKCKKNRGIEVTGFSMVRYMAACGLNKRIYISDEDNYTIHTVQYKDEAQNESKYDVDSFHVDQEPEGLSVTQAGNIVITFQKARQLGIYDMFGTRIRCIDLPESISYPWYAEEMNSDEYLVSHDVDGESQIAKVKVQSLEICAPNFSIIYKVPKWKGARSFARTEDGFVFLADFVKNNIYLLNPNLEFLKIIASGLHGPTRLCYDEKGRHLYVTNHSTKDVFVFKYDAA